MNLVEKIRSIYLLENDNEIEGTSDSTKYVALYNYYHYFDADSTKLEEVSSQLLNRYSEKSFLINSIFQSVTNDNCIDFISYLSEKDFNFLDNDSLINNIKSLSTKIGKLVYHDAQYNNSEEQNAFDELEVKYDENLTFLVTIICPIVLEINKKIELQQKISDLKTENGKVSFNILFSDDIEQEIMDIDSPKENVRQGSLTLMSRGICKFGVEDSFISLISANSLKQLYLKYSTKGLFAANLRFYITSKKIDEGIKNTIKNSSDDFAYLNNGIVITCNDYNIIDNEIFFKDFSIVNGGQTTHIIGTTSFNKDFGIICKVIKSRFNDMDKDIEFLSKVAEASNTQKPIKAKDLIANRIEQRKLKIQFAEAGMFLRIKRGEKIDKKTYDKPYMNATNEEVAQMIYSCIYQSPGAAKNACSKLLSNENTYNQIFKNEYVSNFLKSLQFIKVAYNDWKNYIKKNEPRQSIKYGLSKHMNFYIFGMIGYIMKCAVNNDLFEIVKSYEIVDINSKNDNLKKQIKCNDIGKISILNENLFDILEKRSLFIVFDFLIDEVLVKSFKAFKKHHPNYSYGNFAKSDKYYYDFVLPNLHYLIFHENSKLIDKLGYYFNFNARSNVTLIEEETDYSQDNLKEELLHYRQRIKTNYPELNDAKIIKNQQIGDIIRYYPVTKEELIEKIRFNDDQLKQYGNDVINIVKKYINMDGFK